MVRVLALFYFLRFILNILQGHHDSPHIPFVSLNFLFLIWANFLARGLGLSMFNLVFHSEVLTLSKTSALEWLRNSFLNFSTLKLKL